VGVVAEHDSSFEAVEAAFGKEGIPESIFSFSAAMISARTTAAPRSPVLWGGHRVGATGRTLFK
jgi:hypothetical protein